MFTEPAVGTPTTEASAAQPGARPSSTGSGSGRSEAGPIRATAPMWRCSRIMQTQRDLHPTILNSLEGIVDQVCIDSSVVV